VSYEFKCPTSEKILRKFALQRMYTTWKIFYRILPYAENVRTDYTQLGNISTACPITTDYQIIVPTQKTPCSENAHHGKWPTRKWPYAENDLQVKSQVKNYFVPKTDFCSDAVGGNSDQFRPNLQWSRNIFHTKKWRGKGEYTSMAKCSLRSIG